MVEDELELGKEKNVITNLIVDQKTSRLQVSYSQLGFTIHCILTGLSIKHEIKLCAKSHIQSQLMYKSLHNVYKLYCYCAVEKVLTFTDI